MKTASKKKLGITIAILGLIGSSAVQAESTASAWLGPVSIQLVDLNPNDGIVPTILFDNTSLRYVYGPQETQGYSSVSAYVQDTLANTSSNPLQQGYGLMPRSVSADNAISNGNAVITGSGFSDFNFTASGNAVGPGASGYRGEYAGNSNAYERFVLSANTQVIFSADASTFASSNASYGSGLEWAKGHAELYASIFTLGHFPFDDSAGDAIESKGYNNKGVYNPETDQFEYSNVNESSSRMLSVSVSNTLSEGVFGFFSGSAYVNGYSYSDYQTPSQVPVPAALPLMASALGLFGFAKRRKTV